MKVAFPVSGETPDSVIDSRFGRAGKFLVMDFDSGDFSLSDNIQNLNAVQGAGIQAAENVVKSGASVLVARHCGPKAFKVLSASGVKIYLTEAGTVREAFDLLKKGKLKTAGKADVEGHHI